MSRHMGQRASAGQVWPEAAQATDCTVMSGHCMRPGVVCTKYRRVSRRLWQASITGKKLICFYVERLKARRTESDKRGVLV